MFHNTDPLTGQFTAVQQAIGTARGNTAGIAAIREFVEKAKPRLDVARQNAKK